MSSFDERVVFCISEGNKCTNKRDSVSLRYLGNKNIYYMDKIWIYKSFEGKNEK
jgi:hypothetical protein